MQELRRKLEKELEILERIKNAAERDVRNAPKGTLRIAKNKNTVQYYWRTDPKDTSGRYIRKSEEKLIRSLVQKDYAQKVMAVLESIVRIIETELQRLENYSITAQIAEVYKLFSPERQKLITPYIYDQGEFIKHWENEKKKSSERRIANPDTEIYTEKGECVRSKSEKILADKLYMMGVPYVYEAPLYLRGFGYVHPDFTVLNKRTRREYYWEHFGMMDYSDYSEKTVRKIETYQKAGFFPGEKLLLTYETSQHPLNIKIVEGMMKEYLM